MAFSWWCTLVLCTLACVLSNNVCTGYNTLVVMVDGVRYDYPDEDPTYWGFKTLQAKGIRAKYLEPVFPSVSYASQYAMFTGLHPESNGVLANEMYNTRTGKKIEKYDKDFWRMAKPIWATASGKSTACFHYSVCDAEIQGRQGRGDMEMNDYPDKETANDLDIALKMLQKNQKQLAIVYYESVDYLGHYSNFGPESRERKQSLKKIDKLLFDLQNKMESQKLTDKINLVVLSDHGMINTTPNKNVKVINMDKKLDRSRVKYSTDYGSFSMVLPKPGQLDYLYSVFKSFQGMVTYKKQDIPERYHIKHSDRMLPLLLVAKKGYIILDIDPEKKKTMLRRMPLRGTHGYDPQDVPEMNGIFYARGPSFKKGFVAPPIKAVDVYSILCEALVVQPRPNNGSTSRIAPMLARTATKPKPRQRDRQKQQIHKKGQQKKSTKKAQQKKSTKKVQQTKSTKSKRKPRKPRRKLEFWQ